MQSPEDVNASAWREQWRTEGCVVVRGVFGAAQTARLRLLCDGVLEQWLRRDPEKDTPGDPNGKVMRHLNRPEYFRDRPKRLPELMEAVAGERVLRIARALFGEEPLFRCTSYWFNPKTRGEEGIWHRDVQFLHKDEAVQRKRIAEIEESGAQIQVALVPTEDVEYVPRSHLRWDTPEEYRIRLAGEQRNNRSPEMPGAVRVALEPGDAVLFNPNGIHRGRYHTDKLRRTLMLTYTETSAPCFDYFSDQPWFLAPGYLDGLSPRTHAFFQAFVEEYRPQLEKAAAERTEAAPQAMRVAGKSA